MTPTFALFLALAAPAVQNPGFEDDLTGWTTLVHRKTGRDGVVRADREHFHGGRQSILLEADDRTALAAGQKLYLPVGSLWRVTGWIKTQNLRSADPKAVNGAIEIRTSAGALGRSENRSGSSDWGEVRVVFRAASPGAVTILLVHTTAGQGTGKAWFDDIRLEPVVEAQDAVETVRVTPEKLTKAPIDLKQGGQFIEPLCSLIPSLLAQQVNATSFEEEPPCRFVFRPETDQPPRPWYPDGAVHLAKFSYDTEHVFNGKRSQKIELPAGHARAGISQEGFYLRRNLSYRLRLHIRGEGSVPVRAWLHGDGGTVAGPVSLGRAGQGWDGVEGELRPSRDIDNATLTIDFEGPGTLWLDRVSLIGSDAVLGIWRPDVVAALKELKPGVIRFGGTAIESYEWDQSIGPWDRRAPFTTWWGGLEPNFVGEEEFVQLCRLTGTEPLICIRWTGKKPGDAAAQVEYFNGSRESRWGSLRAKNGHPQPYGVKYWQIGNEIGGPEYDASVRPIAEAMKKADPNIQILSSFPSEETLKNGSGYLDYLSPHHYAVANFADMERDFASLKAQIERDGAGKPVRVAVTEWNTTAGEWGLGREMLQTLGNALGCSRYHNFLHRYADLVEMAMRSNLANSFGSGIIMTGPGWHYFAPTYYAQQLYANAAGSKPLRLERSSDLPWRLQEPDLSATLSADGKTLRMHGVNSTPAGRRVRFTLPWPVLSGTVTVLKDREEALSTEIINSRDDPRRIAPVSRPAAMRGARFEFTFQPLSLTVLELKIGKEAATLSPSSSGR